MCSSRKAIPRDLEGLSGVALVVKRRTEGRCPEHLSSVGSNTSGM